MARKSTKNAVSSADTTMESRVEEIKTEDKAAKTGVTEEKAEEKAAGKKKAAKNTAAKTAVSEKEEVKTETEKKEPAKKETEKKETVKKETAKKENTSVTIQYNGKEILTGDLVKAVEGIWKDDLNRKAGDLNSIELYVKPEEDKAYYVLNKEIKGSLDL